MIMIIVKPYYKNLKKYLRDDAIYQDYIKNPNIKLSDYDKYCVEHCDDIDCALKECETLEMIRREVYKKNADINKIKHIIAKGGDGFEI